jgi:Tol biopolymer transport system component
LTVGSSANGGDWSPDGKWIAYAQGNQLFRAEPDGKNPFALATFPADFSPFFIRWAQDSRLVYFNGLRVDGTYLIYAVPAAGGRPREVVHSEGPSYQNFRFSFNARGNTMYTSLADRQSDVWLADLQGGKR